MGMVNGVISTPLILPSSLKRNSFQFGTAASYDTLQVGRPIARTEQWPRSSRKCAKPAGRRALLFRNEINLHTPAEVEYTPTLLFRRGARSYYAPTVCALGLAASNCLSTYCRMPPLA